LKRLRSFNIYLIFLAIIFLSSVSPAGAQTPNITAQPLPGAAGQQAPQQAPAPSVQQMTPQQSDAYQRLSPTQRGVVESELGKSGGRLTPEAMEALKVRPEFKGLSPEDVAKGKQLLEQKEGILDRKGTERIDQKTPDRNIITDKPKEKSLFDRSRSIGKYQDISVDLKPFGYELFSEAAVQVTTDRKDIPVPLKYVIGPGDEVKLLLWGRVNAQYTLAVDRDGKITIPQIGPMFVAGMTFEEMSKQVIKQSEQIVGTSVDISMGALKTIPIFILGDVRRPGSYTIGSFATMTDALLIAGGPTEIGSMRNVQLKRKGRLVTTFDLYDLLLKGDKSKDMTLMAGDVVFVPVTGTLVGIAGNVKRPAIYEMRNRFDLENLIELAGGIIPTAYTQQLQVERIIRNERQVVWDINDKNLERAAQVVLQDADLVKIFSIVDTNVNVVYLNGNVKRPGKYEIKAGMKLGDLLKGPEDLLPETNFDYALIKRLKPPEMEAELIPFNLGHLLLRKDQSANIELKALDQVFVFNRWFFKDKPFVIIEGEIRGDCNIEQGIQDSKGKVEKSSAKQDQDKRVSDFKPVKPGELSKDDIDAIGLEMKTMEADLKKDNFFDLANMVRDVGESIRTKGRISSDNIRILRDELLKAGRTTMASRFTEIENKTKISCELPFVDSMRVKDVILIAGGLTNNSYLERGEIIRTNKKREYTTIFFNVAKVMEGDPSNNLELKDEDRIIIHSIWEQVYKKNVAIDGDVAKPGSYQFTEGMTVRDLVFKGGNILESAYVDEAEVSSIRTEGRLISTTERKVISLRKALDGDPEHNLLLKPNDRLFVKRIPDWGSIKFVTADGEFRFPGRYTIRKGEKLSSLIERAGGYTSNAYLRGAVFKRESVRALQQRSLEEMANRMQRELLSSTSASVATSMSSEEVQAKRAEAEMKQRLVEYMRTLRATGRMTIAVTNLRLLKVSSYDIALEEGDSLYLPQKSSVVNVVGAVMSEGSHIYNERWDYRDYIGVTGGYARYADTSNVFVIKVDGSARKLNRGFTEWSEKRDRWELAAYGEEIRQIEPGDVIVVPEKISQIAWLREIRDITQILMNTAVVAATVFKLF
jgi:polysaccharide export outer membrane protein